VNLPKRDRMIRPRYQEIPKDKDKIPAVVSTNGKITVRVIAGEAAGANAIIDTGTPIMFASLHPRSR
jgi:quercetin 2,3-dioxygenase